VIQLFFPGGTVTTTFDAASVPASPVPPVPPFPPAPPLPPFVPSQAQSAPFPPWPPVPLAPPIPPAPPVPERVNTVIVDADPVKPLMVICVDKLGSPGDP
jgi:hypothetical protein